MTKKHTHVVKLMTKYMKQDETESAEINNTQTAIKFYIGDKATLYTSCRR